jgi:hypothetical protein
MLKAGDLIIARRGKSDESWWVMERDERRSDINSYEKNSHCIWINQPRPNDGWLRLNVPTSWDSKTVVDQGAVVVRADDIPDEMLAKIARYALENS